MLRFIRALVMLLSLLSTLAKAQKYNVPLAPPPTGFAWQALPESKAAVLLPAGWYFKVEGEKGAPTYYLTQQETGESGDFQVGLSLQVVRKAKAKTGRLAPDYAELLMLRAGFGPGQQQLEKVASVEGVFYKRTVRYRDAPPETAARIVYQMALANAKTDTLYLLTFESPEQDWPKVWQLGQVMLRELVLDSRQ